jgi:hypothetical protein
MLSSPSSLFFCAFLLFSSTGGRFSSVIFPSLSPALGEPLPLSLFFIAPNLLAMACSPGLLQRYAASPPGRKPRLLCAALFCCAFFYALAFLPGAASPYLQALLRCLSCLALAVVSSLTDSLCVSYCKVHPEKGYGAHRLYGAVSWAAMNPLLGYLADRSGGWGATVPFAFAAALLTAFAGRNVILETTPAAPDYEAVLEEDAARVDGDGFEHVTNPDIGAQPPPPPEQTPRRALLALTSSPKLFAFTLAAFSLAAGMSIVEALSFSFFSSALGASPTLEGFTVVVTVLFEIPLFHFADRLLARFGAAPLQCVAMLSYATRVVGYTLVPRPWMILLLEPLHGVTCVRASDASAKNLGTCEADQKDRLRRGCTWAHGRSQLTVPLC